MARGPQPGVQSAVGKPRTRTHFQHSSCAYQHANATRQSTGARRVCEREGMHDRRQNRLIGCFASATEAEAEVDDAQVAPQAADDAGLEVPAGENLAVAGGTFEGSAQGRVGVLLLNLGGPEELSDVEPFLYNLFADPDIIRLPGALQWLQEPLASLIAKRRAPKSRIGYESIGGGSPLRRTTTEQGLELARALQTRGQPARVYIGMRYWKPFTENALEQIRKDGVAKLVVLPLYPQFSISTSGSSLRLLESQMSKDPRLSQLEHIVIPSWYERPGYVRAMARMIANQLQSGSFTRPDEPVVFFSAHGVPKSYVLEAGDPYKEEMEQCVDLIMKELRDSHGFSNAHVLAYQSRVGPVEWLQPYTDERLRELGQDGVRSVLTVPISFVSEHIETLEEIDQEYKELAFENGIQEWDRVPALGTDPEFIFDLADAVLDALPYTSAITSKPTDSLVPQGSVTELLAAYDRERGELPAPSEAWEFGFTKSAELVNGRVAMLGILAWAFLDARFGGGVFEALMDYARQVQAAYASP